MKALRPVPIGDIAVFLEPLVVFFIVLFIGLLVRKLIFIRLGRWSKMTKTKMGDIVVQSIRKPFVIWCVMLSMYIALSMARLPDSIVHISGKILLVLGFISVTLAFANISTRAIRVYSEKFEAALPVTSLTQNITRIAIFGIGISIILNYLGISITPILATLGVGGLAVALALQDTLSSLFAGLHVTMAKQIKIGDYVKLDTGDEGYVTDINWRTTKIKMPTNNVALVPNTKLAQAIVINYYLPEKEVAISVDARVHYTSDLKKVERVTCEVARAVMMEVPGGVPGCEPVLRYHTFGESGIHFTVGLRARELVDQHLIKHEFIKRLHERFEKEGIVVPYPVMAVNYEQEKAAH